MTLVKTPPPSIEALLYHAQMQGVLPITSCCNMRCIFCSNAYNPSGCEIFTISPRPLKQIEDTILWLGGSRGPVIIGESVTRINEGEPLTHPEFLEILQLVRKHYPQRPIQVTTNATLLTEDLVKQIAELQVDLMISLNTVGYREKLMGDRDPERTLSNVKAIGGRVRFEGSIVALPFITGWEDIEDTAKFLTDAGAWSVRILAPGFSGAHPLLGNVTSSTWSQIRALSNDLGERLKIPVLFEPPKITCVTPVVEHVLPKTPAHRAGIRPRDVITTVLKRRVFSRTEAFELIRDNENPALTYSRQGVFYDAVIHKPRFMPSGLVMYDDLSSREWFEWERKSRVKRRQVLVLTSSLAKPIIEAALQKRELVARVESVPSVFFGGNIRAGGLLTVKDFVAKYEQISASGFTPDVVTLPKRAFDPWGRDLAGISYRAFEEITGKPVILG